MFFMKLPRQQRLRDVSCYNAACADDRVFADDFAGSIESIALCLYQVHIGQPFADIILRTYFLQEKRTAVSAEYLLVIGLSQENSDGGEG